MSGGFVPREKTNYSNVNVGNVATAAGLAISSVEIGSDYAGISVTVHLI